MHTAAQNDASRINGAKSQGPVTEAGKARSSQNSYRTGIYVKSEIIAGENPEHLELLVATYYAKHRPDGPDEAFLVDTLIRCHWIHRRLSLAEAKFWNLTDDKTARLTALLAPILKRESHSDASLDRLQRRLTATQRNWERAIKLLKTLQKERRAAEPAPVESIPEAELGFAPSNPPQPPDPPASATNPHAESRQPIAQPAPKPAEIATGPAVPDPKEEKSA